MYLNLLPRDSCCCGVRTSVLLCMCLPRDVDTVSVCDFDPLFDSNLCLYYYYLNFLLNSSSINLVISKMIIFEKLINCWKCLLFSRI